MVSVTSAGRRVSLPLFAAMLCAGLVLGACNLNATTAPDAGESAGGGAYATSQGALEGAGGNKPGKTAGCNDYAWMLKASHEFAMTVAGRNVQVVVSGRVDLSVDKKSGNVTSSGASGVGVLTGSDKDGCQYLANWDYAATVSGTCYDGMMHLSIDEPFGTISGTVTCPKKDPAPFSWNMPAGDPRDSDFLLWLGPDGRPVAQPDSIPWGIGGTGSKTWTVEEWSQLVPLPSK